MHANTHCMYSCSVMLLYCSQLHGPFGCHTPLCSVMAMQKDVSPWISIARRVTDGKDIAVGVGVLVAVFACIRSSIHIGGIEQG